MRPKPRSRDAREGRIVRLLAILLIIVAAGALLFGSCGVRTPRADAAAVDARGLRMSVSLDDSRPGVHMAYDIGRQALL